MESKFILLLFWCLSASEGLRVLVVFPIASKSHNILGEGITKHLLNAGHEVTYTTSYPRTNLPPNLKEIDVSSIQIDMRKQQTEIFEAFKLKNLIGKENIGDSLDFMYLVHDMHKRFLQHDNIRALLNDPKEKYDVVIIEWFFSEMLTGIPAIFQCPFIWLGSTEAHGSLLRLVDEIANPAYSADLFSSITPPFNFWERGVELWTVLKRQWTTNYHIIPLEMKMYENYFSPIAAKRGVSMPSYDDAAYNASFMFLNSHPSVGTSFRLPQSVKYVAGYHIDREVKPLPKDLEKLFNESKHGVIYFSMGSNLQSNDMAPEMKKSLLEMFELLEQTVIWKFEGDLENVPANVHLVKWAPQQSILAHPNLKLFITHGGQLSTTEAIHYGVPVIGLPVLGDQYVNMRAVQRKGFGIMVQIRDELAHDLYIAINQMLQDPTYTTTAKYLSSIYHHRPISPGAEIVHWTEHVVKTHGAPHLRSPALLLSWYQKLYLDYCAVIAAAIILIVLKIRNLLRPKKFYKNKKNK